LVRLVRRRRRRRGRSFATVARGRGEGGEREREMVFWQLLKPHWRGWGFSRAMGKAE
jgi:hypothetical protein